MSLLIAFLFRLGLGLSAAMAVVSHRDVSSGYFRNHLYVVLGLATLAALLCPQYAPNALWYAAAAAGLSYVGSVCWLYEKPRAGKVLLVLVAGCTLAGVAAVGNLPGEVDGVTLPATARWLRAVHPLSSSFVLGSTMAAMLLGHWYLNSPGMRLEPLQQLLLLMGIAVAVQAVVCGWGLWAEWGSGAQRSTQWLLLVVLRWCFGLVGLAVLIVMARQTLKIPNTQSTTGILYVAVIGSFTGEIMSQVLSAETMHPV